MLLVQSAFEVTPLPASSPAVVTTELVAGVVFGVLLLGGTFALGTGAVMGAPGWESLPAERPARPAAPCDIWVWQESPWASNEQSFQRQR